MIIELLNKTMKSKIVICSLLLFSAFSISAQTDIYSEVEGYGVSEKLNSYKKVRLTADLSHLNQAEKDALYFMIEAAKAVNPIFWKQTYGDDYQKLLDGSLVSPPIEDMDPLLPLDELRGLLGYEPSPNSIRARLEQ